MRRTEASAVPYFGLITDKEVSMETKEREAYRKDNDMNEFDKRAEAYMRTVMNNDGDVFTRADLYEYIMDAWKAGYAEAGFDLSLLSGESLSKAQNQKSQPIN